MQTIDDDVVVSGNLSIGNLAWGIIRVAPELNTPTSKTVSGINLEGSGPLIVQLTARSAYPWVRVREVTSNNHTEDSFDVVIYRTSTVPTDIYWFAWRNP